MEVGSADLGRSAEPDPALRGRLIHRLNFSTVLILGFFTELMCVCALDGICGPLDPSDIHAVLRIEPTLDQCSRSLLDVFPCMSLSLECNGHIAQVGRPRGVGRTRVLVPFASYLLLVSPALLNHQNSWNYVN